METKELIQPDAVPVVKIETVEEDFGTLIPEHAIMRFARFLLPRMQEEMESTQLPPPK